MMAPMIRRLRLGSPRVGFRLAGLGPKWMALVLLLSGVWMSFGSAVAAEALQAPRFAYGANASDWSLTQYLVDPLTGQLSHNGNLATNVYPVALIVHPSGRFVLSLSMTDDTLSVYRIDPVNGHLGEITQSPFPTHARSPFSISIHPSGRFVYVSARVGQILAFRFDEQNGVLTPVPGSPFASQRRPRSVKVHPSGRFLYASNAYDNSITAYAIDQTSGALSPLPGSPYGTGEEGDLAPELLRTLDAPPEAGGIPYTLAIHPSGRFLYVTNWLGASLSLFAINAQSGALTPLKGNPMRTGSSPYAVTVHPSGRFVYVTSWDAQAVFGYAVDQVSGQLAELPGSPFYAPAENPIDLTFNAAGTLAYVVQSGANAIALFAVDPASGFLTLQQNLRTRFEPFDIALLEGKPAPFSSRSAYVMDAQQKQVRVFRVSADTGDFETQTQVDTLGQPTATALGPQGRYLYVASADDQVTMDKADKQQSPVIGKGRLAIYRIDASTGELHLLQEPYSLGLTPSALAMDTSGHFLYVIDPKVDGLLVFAVDQETGLLTTAPSPPPSTGKGPVAIALDPAGRYSFVANAGDNTVSVFTHRREGTAAMYPIYQPNSKYAVGSDPRALTVDPSGNFLLVVNRGDNSLSVFNIHFHEGLLEPVAGAPYPTGTAPVDVVVHPRSQWVYVLNGGGGDISRYRFDALQGALKALPGRVDVGPQPEAITLDATGRFAYVRNKGSKLMRKFAVDPATGKLTPAGTVSVGSAAALRMDRVFH